MAITKPANYSEFDFRARVNATLAEVDQRHMSLGRIKRGLEEGDPHVMALIEAARSRPRDVQKDKEVKQHRKTEYIQVHAELLGELQRLNVATINGVIRQNEMVDSTSIGSDSALPTLSALELRKVERQRLRVILDAMAGLAKWSEDNNWIIPVNKDTATRLKSVYDLAGQLDDDKKHAVLAEVVNIKINAQKSGRIKGSVLA